ncbi:MAG: sulfate ABC transporter permease [Rubrobacter sp.]|nr:sulfate ABC transporter permease [Rubrobacter sp.]
MKTRLTLRTLALGYLGFLIILPVASIFWFTFSDGLGTFWSSVTEPDAVSAFYLTLIAAGVAVAANTVFGVLCAIVLVRHRFPGKRILGALTDLPLAVSPVIIGLALILVYGSGGWFGGWLAERGILIIFSIPGIILATIFASLPFVVREVAPVLREVGIEQEQASSTLGASPWQTFWLITLPSIRHGLTYGVVLTTARALGEFGAVAVVSGRIIGRTETLTLHVEDRFLAFDLTGAYAASVVLALLALGTLFAMNFFNREEKA